MNKKFFSNPRVQNTVNRRNRERISKIHMGRRKKARNGQVIILVKGEALT